ncbi:MAG: helix-turn-helix transcriptional regulator [Hyphomicrobium sp.]|uniref:helix-turn-helix transcriptional regulator n=1 Tax=Hyphomicrobium sp. TaxID=82 RepID=UPI0039E3D8AD
MAQHSPSKKGLSEFGGWWSHQQPSNLRFYGMMTASGTSTTASWYATFGAAAKSVGSSDFYRQLLRLLGCAIQHDYVFAVRYGKANTTDVLHTTGHPDFIVEQYRTIFHEVDPFGNYWRKTSRKGFVRSSEVINDTAETRLYTSVFLKRAKIIDEVGIVLPAPGGSCIALFLESKSIGFSEGIGSRIDELFPAIEGLHHAHLARTYGKLSSIANDNRSVDVLPIAIFDRHGNAIYQSASWREAEAAEHKLARLKNDIRTSGRAYVRVSDSMRLRVIPLLDDFAIAPGGRLCALDWKPADPNEFAAEAEKLSLSPLTKLERDVLSLVKLSKSSGQIASDLRIAKGTVKNYKLRLYRKFAVNSERELIGLLAKIRL